MLRGFKKLVGIMGKNGMRYLRGPFLAAVCLTALAAASGVQAQPKTLLFKPLQNPANPDYAAALKVMAPLYKEKTPDFWDAKKGKWLAYPIIGIASVDLNKDGSPELIAMPIEMVPEQENVLCPVNVGCPHFVLQMNKDKIKTIGLIAANWVDTDTSSFGPYTRLRAYTKNLNVDPNYYELYQYDSSQKSYVMMKPD